MQINLILARSQNSVIGANNSLPWHLPRDLKFFKQTTTNHTIIMGRKTFESIGKALPNRTNIVISSNLIKKDNIHHAFGIKQALEIAQKFPNQEIFIIGGAQIYQSFLPLADKIYLTQVHAVVDGDTFFDFDIEKWQMVSEQFHAKDEKNKFDCSFQTLIRKKIT